MSANGPVLQVLVSNAVQSTLATGTFSPNYKLTIGVDFSLKTLEWDSRTKVNLQLWWVQGFDLRVVV